MRIAETADFSPAAKILWGAEGSDLVCHVWHHLRYHAHALREHDRTLGCGFPQRVREVPGRQRQNAGQRLLIAFIFAPRFSPRTGTGSWPAFRPSYGTDRSNPHRAGCI